MGTCARLSTPLLAGGLVVFIIASVLYAADANQQEAWVGQWQVANTLVEYGQDGGQLYHAQAMRVGFANPSPGRTGILYLHPPSRQEPAVLTRQVKIAGLAPVLRIGVCANKDIDGDFVLRVKVDNKQLTEKVIAGAAGWQDLTFDLSAWRDKDVKIDIEAASNDWFYEYAFFDYIEIGDKAKQQIPASPAEKLSAAPEPNQAKPPPQAAAVPVVTKPATEPNMPKAAKVPEPQAAPSKPGEVIFADDFDSENSGRGNLHFRGFKNWFVTKGEVDLVGRGLKDAFPDHGLYIDLSGTAFTGAGKVAGAIQSKTATDLKQGAYTLSFELAVLSPRADAKLIVRLGEVFEQTIPLDRADAKFTAQAYRISVPRPTRAKLVFAHQGTGTTNVLIDNITLTGDVGN